MVPAVGNVPEEPEATVTTVGPKEVARIVLASQACNVLIRNRDLRADLVLVVTKGMECVAREEEPASTAPVFLVSRHTFCASTDKRKLIHDWLIRSSTIRLVTG